MVASSSGVGEVENETRRLGWAGTVSRRTKDRSESFLG